MIINTREHLIFASVLISAFFIQSGHGANILFYFSVSTYSHRITAWPLAVALADRGHQVTFVQSTPNKSPHPKIRDITIKAPESLQNMDILALKLQLGDLMIPMLMSTGLPEFGKLSCNATLTDPQFLGYIDYTKVDLVIIDALFNECAYGVAHKLGSQTIIFGTSTVFEWWPDEFGFLAESSWTPATHMSFDLPLGFFQRVVSTLWHIFVTQIIKNTLFYPTIELWMKELLNLPNLPPIHDMIANTSLVLMNSHFSEDLPRALPPNVVPVGGMHCTDKIERLPKEIEDFVNGSGNDGFIYVSFGSELKINTAPQHIRDAFFNAFKKIKKRIIWKWNGPRPDDMPDNVLTVSWVPQQSILAHPKIKLFITHGGLLSMQEAIWHPVPLISIPVFAEQDYNVERVHRTKRGIKLDITKITEEELLAAMNEVISNPVYLENMKRTSKLFKDRPLSPVDTAFWWVEYVMRHKEDSEVLRPVHALSQNWYQRRLLDVWAFIFAVIISLFYLMLRLIYRCCCKNTSSVTLSRQKKDKVKKS